MEVFVHHIYEYEKGIRNLVLHTTSIENEGEVKRKLRARNIAHKIYRLKNGNINIFFGAKECIDVVESIGKNNLNEYSAEEDFMLGIMLGYDRRRQCERYLKYKGKNTLKVS